MAISEEARHRMYNRLEEVLGPEEATTLMDHLPPVGWADVATRRDLDHLEAMMNARFDRVDARFQLMDGRFEQVDGRFEQLTARFEGRFEQIDGRFEQLTDRFEGRFEQIDGRFEQLTDRFESRLEQIDRRFDESEARQREHTTAEINRALVTQTRTLFFGLATMLGGIAAVAAVIGR